MSILRGSTWRAVVVGDAEGRSDSPHSVCVAGDGCICVTLEIHVEGIFRIPGEHDRCDEIVEKINTGGRLCLTKADAQAAATVMKRWLRALPNEERLLAGLRVPSLVDEISRLGHDSPKFGSTRVGLDKVLGPAIKQLPELKRAALGIVLNTGVKVAEKRTWNKMSKSAFARCLAVSLFEDVSLEATGMGQVMTLVNQQVLFVEYLLDCYEERQRQAVAEDNDVMSE